MDPITIRKLSLGVLVVVAFLAFLGLSSFLETRELERNRMTALNEIATLRADYVEGVLSENVQKAKHEAEDLATSIRQKILVAYGTDKKALAKDLANWNVDDHKITNIVASVIQGAYHNGLQTDSNDPWVATRNSGIVGDYSIDCAAAGRTRTFPEEAAIHSNKVLAETAINAILSQKLPDAKSGSLDRVIYWSFLTPRLPEYATNEMSLSAIRNLIIKHRNVEAIASYEFLFPAYVESEQDLVGVPVVSASGYIRNADQIIVTQGFNLYQVLTTNTAHSLALSQFDNQEILISNRYDALIYSKQFVAIATGFMFLLSVFAFYMFLGGRPPKEE